MSTDWKSDLRQRGYRLTPQRQLVLEAVDALDHATPDDILCEVRRTASGVNISTVYRTLELLEELGLVSHTHLGHGAPTYHLADRHHHIHLVCRDCTDVIETDVDFAADFTAKLRETFGFDTDLKHFAIFGRCQGCTSSRTDRADRTDQADRAERRDGPDGTDRVARPAAPSASGASRAPGASTSGS